MIPQGFTRCDECSKGRIPIVREAPWRTAGVSVESITCPSCSGSGLVPTEKLREEAEEAALGVGLEDVITARAARLAARRVLAKVAEHIREER